MAALLALLFLAMIAAPCVIALRSWPKSEEDLQVESEAHIAKPEVAGPTHVTQTELAYGQEPEPFEPAPRLGARSLQRLAEEAEQEAMVAEEWARKAHWAALDAAARAAAIRADAAAELAALAGRAAEKAIRAAEAEFGESFLHDGHHPGPRGDRRAA